MDKKVYLPGANPINCLQACNYKLVKSQVFFKFTFSVDEFNPHTLLFTF